MIGCTLRGALPLLATALLFGVPGTGPSHLGAQELGTDCDLRSYATINSQDMGVGRRVTFVGRPFLVCPDGTRIRSDSAVVYEETGRAELIGRVDFQTPERHLVAEYADYFEREDRLFARGSVVFRDRVRATVVEGDTLIYLGAGEVRVEEQVTVSGGRPRATIPPPVERDDAVAYEVTGNRLRFAGDQFFWADGEVEVVREDLEASADSLAFNREGGQLFLNRNARVNTEETEMEALRIHLSIPDDIIESITLRGRGRIVTETQDLVGEEIRVTLRDEKIQHVVAVDREPEEGEEAGPTPRALAEDFELHADSLEIITPDEVLERIIAVGRARAESRAGFGEDDPGAGGLWTPHPDSVPEVLRDRIDRDWIEGDEILALFELVEEPADTLLGPTFDEELGEGEARPAVRLLRLEARGNARTLYRSAPAETTETEGDPPDPEDPRPGPISYIVAAEIRIHLVEGALDHLEAIDQVIGIQLEPTGRRGSGDATRTLEPGLPDPGIQESDR